MARPRGSKNKTVITQKTEAEWNEELSKFSSDSARELNETSKHYKVCLQQKHWAQAIPKALMKYSHVKNITETQAMAYYLEWLVRNDLANDPDKRAMINGHTISGQVIRP